MGPALDFELEAPTFAAAVVALPALAGLDVVTNGLVDAVIELVALVLAETWEGKYWR